MERLNGNQILKMYKNNEFKEGDILIAFEKDLVGDERTSVYECEINHNKSTMSFQDIKEGCDLDAFDLAYCEFVVVRPKRASDEERRDVYNEVMKALIKSCANAPIIIGDKEFVNRYKL